MKYRQQTYTVTEIDTETNQVRIITAWTKNLGTGNGQKKPKSKDIQTGTLTEEEL